MVKALMNRFIAAGFAVSHYVVVTEIDSLPAVVYYETGEDYRFAGDRIYETTVRFNIDYYTCADEDENKEKIKLLLLESGVFFKYRRYSKQEKPVVIQHSFECEIVT